jgi:O-antigen/teichoic acid export membrane protein
MVISKLLEERISRLRGSTMASDAAHLSLGQTVRLIIQAAYYVLLARLLGASAFGAFAAVVANAAIISPFSGFGSPSLFVKNVRAERQLPSVCWGNGLLITCLSGTLLSSVVALTNWTFSLGQATGVITAICVSDLILCRIVELGTYGFLACNHAKETAIQNVLLSILRLVGLVVLASGSRALTLQRWSITYLITSMIATSYCVYRGTQIFGVPRVDFGKLPTDLKEGVFFSINNSATTIYNDVDKVMLSKLSDFGSTGIYAAAYRLIDVATQPIRSLAGAAYPRFFERGAHGMRAPYGLARSLIFPGALYGSVVATVLLVGAPLLPHILGQQYANASVALRWLAFIPLLRSVHVFLADSLSGAGFLRVRSAIQVFVAGVNILLNLLVLPKYSWRGAAWSSLACDGTLVVLFWFAVQMKLRREEDASQLLGRLVKQT